MTQFMIERSTVFGGTPQYWTGQKWSDDSRHGLLQAREDALYDSDQWDDFFAMKGMGYMTNLVEAMA